MAIIKDRVYAQNPRDRNQMKVLIAEEFISLHDDVELCQTICNSVYDRCQMCKKQEGKQFEH